jgi:hypothetical protein
VVAYLFWHRPREPSEAESYERAQTAFHRSLARTPPVGLRAAALFRVDEPPWLGPAAAAVGAGTGEPAADAAPVYEDWYLLEDFTALGVLNEAAVGHGHRSTHDEAARRFGSGAGALYGLVEGELSTESLSGAAVAVWVARPPGSPRRGLVDLLGDGMDPSHASLWRRHLVLGPAPEFCLLAGEAPAGVGSARLPEGWTATVLERELLWSG